METLHDQIAKIIEFCKQELATIRTGRATPSLIEHVMVEYYGTNVALNTLGNISVPESNQLLIETWDANAIQAVEKAIRQSTLGLAPAVDGQRIRITLPQLTEERRQEFVKIAKQKAEAARVAIRKAREEAIKEIKVNEKSGALSEDASAQEQKDVQKAVDAATGEIDLLLKRKEEDILKV